MRELDNKELDFVGGAGDPLADPNSQILRQVMANAAWGAAFGIRGGLPGMAVGMAGGVAQTVIQGLLPRCLLMYRSLRYPWGQHGMVVKGKVVSSPTRMP